MPSRSSHRASSPPSRRRRPGAIRSLIGRRPGLALAITVATALVGSAVVVTSADALTRDAPGTVQAENWSSMSGAQREKTADNGGGQNVGWLASGDWLKYKGVNLGAPGSLATSIRVASANSVGGTLELRADSLTGKVLASYTIKKTGNWQSWVTQTQTKKSKFSGKHDVVVTLHSPQPADFVNLNWFTVVNTPDGSAAPAPTSHAPAPGSTMPPMPGMDPTGPATTKPATTGPSTPAPGGPSAGDPTSAPTMTMAPAPVGGWVAVDPAKQAADTKAFFARTPKPITGNPVRVPEFNAGCAVSHHNNDDPIVFPGKTGASHNHTFMGNKTTDADSTLASLKAGGTTCTPTEDRSAYWIPSLLQNGKVVDPKGTVTVYYGSRLKDPSKTQPFPEGFRMITGDSKNQVDTPDKQGNHFWCAGIGGEVGRTADGLMPICAPTAELVRQVTFPDCWDGKHLDSPDHKSHVGPADNKGVCSGDFPVAIPSISFVIGYPLGTDTSGISLSSGSTFSMHADFFNAWDPDALAERVRNCIDQNAKCSSAGNF